MFRCVGIVGVGLIGASIGLALKKRRLCERVIGIGRRESTLRAAQVRGAIDDAHVGIGGVLCECDLVIIGTPIDQIASSATEIAQYLRADALLTDVGSVKGQVVSELETKLGSKVLFVGSHPLAGREKQGPEAALADLFEGKTCVVTPTAETNADAVAKVTAFWEALGMRVFSLSPPEHDRILASTSHLPHLAASALAGILTANQRSFTGSGFRDSTRIASGSPSLWVEIFRQNRQAVLTALDAYMTRLAETREALEHEDYERVEELLIDGKRNRDALGG